jgi:hypothetical protein
MFIAKRINIILPRDKKVVQTNVRLRTVSQLYQYVKDTSKKKKKKKKKIVKNFLMYQYKKSTRK